VAEGQLMAILCGSYKAGVTALSKLNLVRKILAHVRQAVPTGDRIVDPMITRGSERTCRSLVGKAAFDLERTLARLQKAMLRATELHAAFGQSRTRWQSERLTPFLPATPMVFVVVIIPVRLEWGIDAGKVCSVIRQPGALVGRSLRVGT
jgi:hypothetical protein